MRVAVIGAGVAGLAAAKCLLEEGCTPVVFEQTDQVGGLWNYDESLPDGGGPAYRGLRTNTSKQTMAYSDFPFPEHLPPFPPRAAVLEYLNDYTDHFDVRRYIQFQTEIVRITPAEGGRWTVQTRSSDGEGSDVFDAVMVCNGVFRDPVLPEIPGTETFTGTIMHSRSYTTPEQFTDQRVVVVGAGSSATDVAIEASAVARQVYLSVRGTTVAAPTVASEQSKGGWRRLLDRVAPNPLRTRLVRRWALWRSRWRGPRTGAPDAPFVWNNPPFVPKARLSELIASGAVTMKSGIAEIQGDEVVWSDGSRTTVDAIVFGTGYALSFPFLDTSIFQASMRGLHLYRLIFPPAWPTLAFIGMFRVSGPAPPVAEMQARWAVRVLRGLITLPPGATMRAMIAARTERIMRTGANPFRLNAEAYEDMLAAEVGALPRLWRHLRLWRALLLGPPIAARYRLDGPGRWVGAADVLLAGQDAPLSFVERVDPAATPRTESA